MFFDCRPTVEIVGLYVMFPKIVNKRVVYKSEPQNFFNAT